MVEWLTILFDSRIFMKINAGVGFLLLGFFIYFYFSKEGRDVRGRGRICSHEYFGIFLNLVYG